MIKNRDIIVMGIQPWDISIGSNCKNIAMEFSRNNRVLYVNSPLDRFSRIRDRNSEKVRKRMDVVRGRRDAFEKVNDNLWVYTPDVIISSINKIPSRRFFDFFNFRNNRKLAQSILKAIRKLNFRDYLIFNDQHMFLGYFMKEMLEPAAYIYYIRDNLVRNPYWARHGNRIEPMHIRKADVVVCNSDYYTEYALRYNPKSYMVGQGCETSMFDEDVQDIPLAEELKELKGPIAGYIGYLTSRRLDINLLENLAKERRDLTLVLVGPEDENFKNSTLHGMSNVIFTGSKDPSSLAGYLKAFDVALNPQQVNEATIGNYPRKIDEYLVMGKPTVATYTRAMDYFKDVCYLATSAGEYPSLIDRAIKEDNAERQEARKKAGRSHTWENSVEKIYASIQKV